MQCNTAAAKGFLFEINKDNTGTLRVNDDLLITREQAEERARSEMLKSSYIPKNIRFKTYRTDLNINDTINVKGLPYLVKGAATNTDSTTIVTTIMAVRYD